MEFVTVSLYNNARAISDRDVICNGLQHLIITDLFLALAPSLHGHAYMTR